MDDEIYRPLNYAEAVDMAGRLKKAQHLIDDIKDVFGDDVCKQGWRQLLNDIDNEVIYWDWSIGLRDYTPGVAAESIPAIPDELIQPMAKEVTDFFKDEDAVWDNYGEQYYESGDFEFDTCRDNGTRCISVKYKGHFPKNDKAFAEACGYKLAQRGDW